MRKGLLNKIVNNDNTQKTTVENVAVENIQTNNENYVPFLNQKIDLNFNEFKPLQRSKAVYEVDNDKNDFFAENEYGTIVHFKDDNADCVHFYNKKDPV